LKRLGNRVTCCPPVIRAETDYSHFILILYQIVADWYTVTTSGDAHFLVVCRHCYVLKGYVLKGYVLKGYVLKGYVLKGYVLKGYVLKGYVLKGYVLSFCPSNFPTF